MEIATRARTAKLSRIWPLSRVAEEIQLIVNATLNASVSPLALAFKT
jgi:hypothetical protein